MRIGLAFVLMVAVSLTPEVRGVLGLPCPCSPVAASTRSALEQKTPACSCARCQKSESSSESPSPVPFSRCGCGEWCCGALCVPLTVMGVAPLPTLTPELAAIMMIPPLAQGEPLRLEDPPRQI